MPLVRKVRSRGCSLCVVIPHDLAAMMGLLAGDEVEIETLGRDQVLLRRRPRPDGTH